MRQTNPRAQRGMSLVEGMMSMAVLVIGILGALQGILFASQQNAVAARLARASSMAAQIRLGIEAQGFVKLVGLIPSGGGPRAGLLADTSICIPISSASANLRALTDGMDATAITGACILDVDAYDGGAAGGGSGTGATAIDMLVAGYKFDEDFKGDRGPFRRVVVLIPSELGASSTGAYSFAVVVSTTDTGRRVFVRQFAALYDPSPSATPSNPSGTGNGSGVAL